MEKDIIAGIILLGGVLVFITTLLIYSRYVIEKIAKKKITNYRDILKELKNG